MRKNYDSYYNDLAFWEKIKEMGKKVGKSFIEKALLLFYVFKDKDTPIIDKGIIIGALGYLIFPVDAIPDFIPIVGYSDDAGALVTALKKVSGNITKEHRIKAKEQIDKIFR